MRGALPLSFALLVASVVSVGSCKPKPGGTCETDACGDEHTLLVCKHNRFLPVTCAGPKGCKVDGATAYCDFSQNAPGSECDERFHGKRMCRDGKSLVDCVDGKFLSFDCGGPLGCTSNADSESLVKDCDATLAKEGDACDRNFTKKPACDANGQQTLECGKDNRFGFFRFCRGPKGCVPANGEAVCDQTVAIDGDPCTPGVPEVCSTDNVAMLLCDGTKMFERPCQGVNGCKMGPNGPLCDSLVPKEGMTCDKKGFRGCSKTNDTKDHGKLLECNGSKFVVKQKCANECVFTRKTLTYECK